MKEKQKIMKLNDKNALADEINSREVYMIVIDHSYYYEGYTTFKAEEYIKQGEPDKTEKSEAWQTAIGLQAVDGLNTSDYLLDTAKEHIEGKITIDEAKKRIHSYYEQRSVRTETEKKPKKQTLFRQELQSY